MACARGAMLPARATAPEHLSRRRFTPPDWPGRATITGTDAAAMIAQSRASRRTCRPSLPRA
jgi:hypothetical protein